MAHSLQHKLGSGLAFLIDHDSYPTTRPFGYRLMESTCTIVLRWRPKMLSVAVFIGQLGGRTTNFCCTHRLNAVLDQVGRAIELDVESLESHF